MFPTNRLGRTGIGVIFLLTVTACNAAETPRPTTPPTAPPSTSSSNAIPPTSLSHSPDTNTVRVPESFGTPAVMAGTILDHDCDSRVISQGSTIKVFDPFSGGFVEFTTPTVSDAESSVSYRCEPYSVDKTLYMGFVANYRTKPVGLEGSKLKTSVWIATPGRKPGEPAEYSGSVQLTGTAHGLMVTQSGRRSLIRATPSNASVWEVPDDRVKGMYPTVRRPSSPEVVAAMLTNGRIGIVDAANGRIIHESCGSYSAGWQPRFHAWGMVSYDSCDGKNDIALYGWEARREIIRYTPDKTSPVPTGVAAVGRKFAIDTFDGLRVVDMSTGKVVLNRSAAEVSGISTSEASVIGDRLYLGNRSVIRLPDGSLEAQTWTTRPIQNLNGWTLVSKTPSSGSSTRASKPKNSLTLVRDVDGEYPGPWS